MSSTIIRAVVGLSVVASLLIACMGDDQADTSLETTTATAAPATAGLDPTATAPTSPQSTTSTPASPASPVSTNTVPPTAESTPASPTTDPSPSPAEQLTRLDLVAALQSGGYVIYFRHAATDWSGADTDREQLENCETQRVLNDAGKAQAREIGVAFQQMGIPVGAVLSSEYCRAADTARIAFGGAEMTVDLTGLVEVDDAEQRRRLDALRNLLATTMPPDGTNTVLVSHQFNLRDAVGIDLATEGAAAIFRPDGAGFELVALVEAAEWLPLATSTNGPRVQQYAVPPGSGPHDVAPAADGGVWYTAQRSGELGWLDPVTGETRHIALGPGSAPHGVIVGPDGAPWITDSGLNAIVRVDPHTDEVRTFPLPAESPNANLNTAAFDGNGILWFTGQAGFYGRVDPATGDVRVWDAPRGPGPYGIDATPDGGIYYASLAGSHIARIDIASGEATIVEPPTPGQGARRVWSDSQGRIWISEWNAGQVGMFDPSTETWQEWRLPGDNPMPYAVYVDERDIVWLSDFGANALVRFDPASETFESFPLPATPANVRQILGRPHEVWGAESAADTLMVLRVP